MELSLTGLSAKVAMLVLLLPWVVFVYLLIKVKLALDEIRDMLREGKYTIKIEEKDK